jgi:hypothetical protein
MKTLQILGCLACAIVALGNTGRVEGTEFSGGWLTGTLLSMADIGTALFVVALVMTFRYVRIAGSIGIASSVLCLPLYLYFMAPVPFNELFGFGHEFKVHPSAGVHWDVWAIAGVLTLAVTTYVCVRSVAIANRLRI